MARRFAPYESGLTPHCLTCRFRDVSVHERRVHGKVAPPRERVTVPVRYSDDLRYECTVCSNRFRVKLDVQDHIRLHHEQFAGKVSSLHSKCFF